MWGIIIFYARYGTVELVLGKVLGENTVYIEKESGRKCRDLLGPPEEGIMLGGGRFKARQLSELVFYGQVN